MLNEFKRKNIRLPSEHYKGQRLYFVTTCFERRRPHGSQPLLAWWLIERLRTHAVAKGFMIHAYCLMPDHLHLLAEGANEHSDLLEFVTSFKKETGFEFRKENSRHLWQFKFYDHILRTGESLEDVCWYIWLNPVRKGICSAIGEHKFSGSFTNLGADLLKAVPVPGWTPPWKKKIQG